MMLYKSCPKCRGDMGVEFDIRAGGDDVVCLQCGYIARPAEREPLLRLIRPRPVRLAPVPVRVPGRRLR